MIVRIFQVTVFPEKRDAFREFFLNTALPLMERQDGLVRVSACLPEAETPNDFAMVMVWRDLDALEAFVDTPERLPGVEAS